MEQIRQYFEKTDKLSDADWNIFSSKLVKEEFPKKALLLQAGQTEKYLSFVESGVIRFYIPKEEQDLTFAFVFDNEFVSAYDSFLTQLPANYNVEVLSDTVLWRLSYKDLQDIYAQTEIGNTIGRHASEGLFWKNPKENFHCLMKLPNSGTVIYLQSSLV